MTTIWNYPVKFFYGYSTAYGTTFHTGEDRPAPIGTPVTVNGFIIGLSGNTGKSTGPHCHIGHWRGGTHMNPNGGGANVSGAIVSQIDTTGYTENGKFVRVQDADGTNWVYLHLNEVRVQVGQSLTGASPTPPQEVIVMPPRAEVINAYIHINGREASQSEINDYSSKSWTDPQGLYYGKILVDIDNMRADIAAKTRRIAELEATSGTLNRDSVLRYVQDHLT